MSEQTSDWQNKKIIVELSGQELDWIQSAIAHWISDDDTRHFQGLPMSRLESELEQIDNLYKKLGTKLQECGFDD